MSVYVFLLRSDAGARHGGICVITAGELSVKYCGLIVNSHLFSGDRRLEFEPKNSLCVETLPLGYKDTYSSGAAVSLLLALSCGFSRANNIY